MRAVACDRKNEGEVEGLAYHAWPYPWCAPVDGAGRLESGVNACGVLELSGAGSGIQNKEWDSLDWGSGLGGVGAAFLAPVRVRLPSCPYSRVQHESRDCRHVAADAATSWPIVA